MHFAYAGTWVKPSTDPGVPGHDSFYHIKMAALLPEVGLVHEFPWLEYVYFTDEGKTFISHHYGFHVLLAPFVHLSKTVTGDYLPGARWAIATLCGINLILLFGLLRMERVPWRWFWLIVFVLLPYHYFTRHAYVRAIAPSLVCMLLLLWCLFRGYRWRAALMIAIYIHVYAGGIMYAPVIVVIWLICHAIAPMYPDRYDWKTAVVTLLGWTAAMLIHPYANGMIEFLKVQVLGSGLSPDISVGREWKPYSDTWWFANLAGVILSLWVIAVFLRLARGGKANARELTLLALNIFFFAFTLKARRFVEYWPVFAMLSAATLSGPVIRPLAEQMSERLQSKGHRRQRVAGVVAVGICVLATFALANWSYPWVDVRNSVHCNYDIDQAREALTFLQENSAEGSIVFTDDWDVFPLYFYLNHHNHYIVGLDPKFTQQRDPELWERYVKISRGQIPGQIYVGEDGDPDRPRTRGTPVVLEDIRTHFKAQFVITDPQHKELARKLDEAPEFAELIYPPGRYAEVKNAPYVIFAIKSEGS